jgi:hypothetical protein
MNKLVTAIVASFMFFSVPAIAEDNAPKTKQVCKDVVGKDGKVVKNKDGTVKQTCKTIKVRKKYEGTSIEDAKKEISEKKK